MESRKRSNQPLEREKGNVKRVKHAIKVLFPGEGGTGTCASTDTFPGEDTLCNGPSNCGSETEREISQSVTNNIKENNQLDLAKSQNPGPQNPRVDPTSTKTRGLKKLLKTGVLGPVTGALGPIKQVAEIFVDCVDTYKVADNIKVEHDELVARLEGLFEDLMGYFDDGCPQSMTTSMKRLCKSIQEELEAIKYTNQKSTTSRYLSANDEEDAILACLRRVEGYLERLSVSTTAMWYLTCVQQSGVEDELTNLLHDAQRFVDMFASNPVSQSTPHIYVSMLTFWPKSAPIAEHYAHFAHGPVLAEGTALDQQQIAQLATWSFDGPVNEIAISSDGRHIALAVDTNVLVVDASSGQVILGPLHGHSETVQSVIFSPDQSRLISGSWSYQSMGAAIVGWDTCTGDIVLGPLQLHGHTGWTTFLSFSPESTRIVTDSSDGGVRVWDAKNGKMVRCLKNDVRAGSSAFSSDGTQLAAIFWAIEGPSHPVLQVWSIHNGNTTLGPLSINGSRVITFSPDNSHIAFAEQSNAVVCVRDAQKGDIVHRLHHPHSNGLALIKYAPDGSQIVTVGDHRTIVVWDVHSGEIVLGPLEGHTGRITSLAFSVDGSYIISACSGGRVCKWNAQRCNSAPHLTSKRPNEILSVKLSPDGKRFASGSADGTVCVWDAYTGQRLVGPIKAHTAAVKAVDFSNYHVASVSKDGAMCVFDALSGDVVPGPIEVAPEGSVRAIAYSPGGSLIATASAVGLVGLSGVNLWDARTGARVLGPLERPSQSDYPVRFYSVLFSPDATRVVCSFYQRIVIWDVLTGKFVSEFRSGDSRSAVSVSYSPNCALVASGSTGIILWDAYSGTKKLGPLTGHTGRVNSVSFSPDSSHLVSGSDDKAIRMWDVETGEIVFELPHGHEQGIRSVAYSPDGTRIISLSWDMSVRVHDARSTEERAALSSTTEYGDWMLSKDGDGSPVNRRAAVLVLLFVRDGYVRVWLNTHSKSLRSHPGQVRLPRERCDPEDRSVIKTAICEAHEEVGLAYNHPHVYILTTLVPFLSQFRLLVTPIIAWATNSEFIHELKANESKVDEVWDHPLEAMLSPELVRQPGVLSRPLAEKNTEGWPYDSDVYEPYDREWMRGTHYRMHRFRSVAVPIKVLTPGTTADILIHTAEIAYGRQALFSTRADDQLDFVTSVKYAIEEREAEAAKKAAEQEQLA